MTAVLIRQSDGSRLTIDAVLDGEVQVGWDVTEHPIETDERGLGTVVDHVRRQPTPVHLRCLWTERPTSAQATRGGPDRVREVLAWLSDAGGELLTIALPHRPSLRNMVLTGAPWEYRASEDLPARLSFREAQFVSSSQVEGPSPTARRRPKPGTETSQSDEKDKGPASGQPERRTSVLQAALKLVAPGLFQ